jgi:hypothetical protein
LTRYIGPAHHVNVDHIGEGDEIAVGDMDAPAVGQPSGQQSFINAAMIGGASGGQEEE